MSLRVLRALGILLSVLAAILSVWWLNSSGRNKESQTQPVVKTLSLVVAAEPLRYGQKITSAQVRVIEWRGENLPVGAFKSAENLGINENGPYALAAIAQGAPILRSQITAAGQKPNLSARLGAGEVAVTIPVNTITGVAGFVLPEERVDVILNRQQADRRYADIILQNIRVLAVNSVPDTTGSAPVQAKSVTFATLRDDAQKLIVASGLGTISLVLRSPTGEGYEKTERVSDLDLARDALVVKDVDGSLSAGVRTDPSGIASPSVPQSLPQETRSTQITIFRGLESKVVTVP